MHGVVPLEAEFEVAEIGDPHEVFVPPRQTLPLVFASPHSGNRYPPGFIAQSRLDRQTLRRSEDSFVDEIFQAAPALGAPLIRARFPRAYIDPNREPFELDPAMFLDELPTYANTRSPRVAAGLGTIARVVATGADIYRGKLSFDEALERIRHFYWPYHAALRSLIDQTRDRFGFCILVDCHSMPSTGLEASEVNGRPVDFVIGDCHGMACASSVMQTVVQCLRDLGYSVRRNTPYSGGFVTSHYGRPEEGLHTIQIEINRALYMDERHMTRLPGLDVLSERLGALVSELGALDPNHLAAKAKAG